MLQNHPAIDTEISFDAGNEAESLIFSSAAGTYCTLNFRLHLYLQENTKHLKAECNY